MSEARWDGASQAGWRWCDAVRDGWGWAEGGGEGNKASQNKRNNSLQVPVTVVLLTFNIQT